jgi:hypothetical protein
MRETRIPEARLPFGRSQLVTVTTPSTANAEFAVPHELPPSRAQEVQWLVVDKDRAVDCYRSRRTSGVLYLKATVASAVVTLLLFLPREASDA